MTFTRTRWGLWQGSSPRKREDLFPRESVARPAIPETPSSAGSKPRRARVVRRPTLAEKMLFPHFDHLAPGRTRFRRWEMVGSHVADFACHRTRIAIRLDGMQKGLAGLREAEAAQAAWRKEGYRVLRFWNAEVLGQIEVVLDTIQAALRAADHDGRGAVPSPQVSLPSGQEA